MFPLQSNSLADLTLPLAGFWFREAGTAEAGAVDNLYYGILAICVVFFVLIVALMVLFVARYYARPGHQAEHTPHHNNTLEAAWSIFPGFLVVGIFWYGVIGYLDLRTPPENAYEINVVAKKWNWAFEYPNGVIRPNLHVPQDRPVKLIMRSDDVLHSLYIPAFRVKMDCVPGRYSTLWFSAKEATPAEDITNLSAEEALLTGSDEKGYDLFCTEYCGQGHSSMNAKVYVHESGTFEAWLEEANKIDPASSPVELGRNLWLQRGCKQCHSIDGKSGTGPTWQGTYGTEQEMVGGAKVEVDPNYIRESILNPMAKIRAGYKGVMPSYQGQLKDAELDALIYFIRSLKDGEEVPETWEEAGGVPGQEEEGEEGTDAEDAPEEELAEEETTADAA